MEIVTTLHGINFLLGVFDVANHGEEPSVYISRDKGGGLCSAKGQRHIKALCLARSKENLTA